MAKLSTPLLRDLPGVRRKSAYGSIAHSATLGSQLLNPEKRSKPGLRSTRLPLLAEGELSREDDHLD